MNIDRFMDKERGQRIKLEIRRVLMNDWDPIGVSDEPLAADEYDSYIGGLYELLGAGASSQSISNHLREIEIGRMGFADQQVPHRLDVAAALKQISLD